MNNVYRVVCPIAYHDPNPEISKSYPYTCKKNSDYNCDKREGKVLELVCYEETCLSVEK
jgi:hypothetical protein